MAGGPRRSKEQSLPAYPSWQVQLPNNNYQKFALNLKTRLCYRIPIDAFAYKKGHTFVLS